jgi:phage-related protein
MGTLGSLVPDIGDIAAAAQETISKLLEPLAGIGEMISGAISAIKGKIAGLLPDFGDFEGLSLGDLPIPDLSSLGGGIANAISGLTSAIGGIASSVTSLVSSALGSLQGALDAVIGSISGALDALGAASCSAVTGVIDSIGGGISSGLDAISNAANTGDLGASVNDAAAAAADGMKGAADAALSQANDLMGGIKGQIDSALAFA